MSNVRFTSAASAGILLSLAASACSITVENNVPEEEYTVQEVTGQEFWDALAKEGIAKERISPDDDLAMTEDSAFVYQGDMMLLLHGSSSCPPVPEVRDIDGVGENGITIIELVYADQGDTPCTDDYGQHFFLLDFIEKDVVPGATVSLIGESQGEMVERFIPVLVPTENEEESS